jgi:phosphatidylinositol 4-kinase
VAHACAGKIATKMPILVLENAHDAASEIEYSTVIGHEYAHSVSTLRCFEREDTQRLFRSTGSSLHAIFQIAQARYANCPWDRLMMQDIESMRSAAGLPSSLGHTLRMAA